MDEPNQGPKNDELSAVQLLQDINNGFLDPTTLDKVSRQKCVELLVAEGYLYSHAAQVLKVSEKTIKRDMKEIRARNALTPNLEFAKGVIGDLFQKGLNHHAFLMRIARSKDSSNIEKIQAEASAWRVLRELIESLQSLGYLPLKPQELAVVGKFSHQVSVEDEEKSFAAIEAMIVEIENAARDTGSMAPELETQIKQLQGRLEKARLISEVQNLADKQNEAPKEDADE